MGKSLKETPFPKQKKEKINPRSHREKERKFIPTKNPDCSQIGKAEERKKNAFRLASNGLISPKKKKRGKYKKRTKEGCILTWWRERK